MSTHRRIPVPILLLFAFDLLLVIMPGIDFLLGSPWGRLRNFVDLDAESSLPTWYASMQWFCAAGLFGLLAFYAWRRHLRGGLHVGLLGLAFLAFSIDEIVQLHEWLGEESDVLLPGATRSATAFSATGIWPFVVGIPVLALLAFILLRMRLLFVPRARRALRLLITGIVIMFTGALMVELAANLVEAPDSGAGLLQVMAEEFLEMLGVSFIVWSGYEGLRAHGVELLLPTTRHTAADDIPTAKRSIENPAASPTVSSTANPAPGAATWPRGARG